jgi:uncharacterized protein (TIGR02246 family)
MTLLMLTLLSLLPLTFNDEREIRDLVARYVEAREKIDPAAVESLFTAEADQLVSSGEWRRGRAALVSGTMASSRRNSGHRTITIETIRHLTAEIAIVDGRYDLAAPPGTPAGVGPLVRKMWTTLLVQRTAAGWRIAAIRNMLPAPPAETRPADPGPKQPR